MRGFFDQALAAAQAQDAGSAPATGHRAERCGAAQPALGDLLAARRAGAPADRPEPHLLPLPEQPGLAPGAPAPGGRPARPGRRRQIRPTLAKSAGGRGGPAEAELAAARAGLGDIPVTELARRGQVTLDNIAARLRDGYDILYLVAHGMLVDGEPRLLLEQRGWHRHVDAGPGTGDAHPRAARAAPAGGAGLLPERRERRREATPRTTACWPGWARGWPRPACRR